MKWIVGVDEAGRGPLAGPVAVGAVLVAEDVDLHALFPGLNDSKKLSEKVREEIYEKLIHAHTEGQVRFQVEFRSAALIDERGISPCIRESVAACVRALMPEPQAGKVFLDGSLKAPAEYAQETVIGGDAIVPAIMLASVAAKVLRDRLLVKLANEYPLYGFERHKGYGTKAHREAIQAHGPCVEHRRSYLKNVYIG